MVWESDVMNVIRHLRHVFLQQVRAITNDGKMDGENIGPPIILYARLKRYFVLFVEIFFSSTSVVNVYSIT